MSAETQHAAAPEQSEKTAQFMIVTGLVAILTLALLGAYLSGFYAGSLGLAGALCFIVTAGFAWARFGLASSGMAAAAFWAVSGLFFALVN